MVSLVFIVLFFFCLAIGVASVLVSYQFITNYNTSFNKNYFYYLISFYAYAIYGIWGQIIVRTLLAESGTTIKVVESIANFLPILGVPFLFVSWIMLINMAYSFFEGAMSKWWRVFHVILFAFLIAVAWFGYNYFNKNNHVSNEILKYFGVVLISFLGFVNYLAFLSVVVSLGKRKKGILGRILINRFAWLLMLAFLIRTIAISFSFSGSWILAVVILVYFASNFFPLYYLRLKADVIFLPVKAERLSQDKIEKIVSKFKISRREKEIVKQICTGKTNQQIADELFISLQTVKDHTHRIYTKIGINSRMKLVQMVNG